MPIAHMIWQKRESLPLPEIKVNLGAYKHSFGENTNRTTYLSDTAPGEVEIVASVNATWSVWGSNGLLNQRKKAKALLDKEIALKEMAHAKHHAAFIY